jgi:peptidoglycan/LPS O-acetylase OafA/YrhL
MKTSVHLRKSGYDPFFDFTKGICILFVIWLHSMPKNQFGAVFWASQAVPLFLFMQVFHALKGGGIRFPDWRKLFRRIILPYVVTLVLICILRSSLQGKFHLTLRAGPGAYYPFVYIQFAVLIPLFARFARAFKGHFRTALLAATLLASIASELVASWIHVPNLVWIYLCARYLFIIGLAAFWLEGRIRLTPWTFLLSLASLCFLWLFRYAGFKWPPFFFDTPWSQCHWVCYFHPAFLCPVLLGMLYRVSFKGLKKLLIALGKASYEIFLSQMAVIAVLGSLFRANKSLACILLAWTLSLGLGLALHRLLDRKRSRPRHFLAGRSA